MCGIAGVIDRSGVVSSSELERLANSLRHRGPDDIGIYVSKDRKLGFAHTRLAILDLSPRGKQPLVYNDRYVIVYNGEIYNYLELRNFLVKKGYKFQTGTDTEVIPACFDYWGTGCLEHFDGMFAFALYDTKANTVFFARDRTGEKPIYFYRQGNRFIFASEIKAFWTLGLSVSANVKRIVEYLYFGVLESVSDNKSTFYNEVFQLPPAHYLVIDLNGEEENFRKYWKIHTDTLDITYEEARNTIKRLLCESIERRLRADVAIGTSLSGGLDSSTVVSLLAREFNIDLRNFNAFSSVFPDFEKNEEKFVDIISRETGINVVKIPVTEHDAVENFDSVLWAQEEPFGSGSVIAQYLVFKTAREHNTIVLLDGQGADEIFGGYLHFWETYLREIITKSPVRFITELRAFMENPTFKKKGSLWRVVIPAFLGKYTEKFRKLLARHIDSLAFTKGIHPDLLRNYIDSIDFPAYYGSNLKEHLVFAITKYGLLDLLHYADRNSMAHSVEVRLPFLYHKLIEFALSLPAHYLINRGVSKRILRDAMKGIVPEEIRTRKDKIGFEVPQNRWLNHPVFQRKLNHAIANLRKKKIIYKPHHQMLWQYLVLNELMERINWKMA